ncbi:unnamed protein product [Caenorhabditis nigoni]
MATSEEGNVGKVPDSTLLLEKMQALEKLMLAVSTETEEIKKDNKQKFDDISNKFQTIEASIHKWEEHYNVKWRMSVLHSNDHLLFLVYLNWDPIAPADKWSIRTKLEFKVVGRNQNDVIRTYDHCCENTEGFGFQKFLEWGEMQRWYLVDGNLTVEAKTTIVETTGLGKMRNRKFDESQKDFSDVILVVGDTKFYVSKMVSTLFDLLWLSTILQFLASQSSVFKALLLGSFKESKESEVKLTGIDPEDFHYFLEVLYGEPAIDDMNVEDIARLADMYDAPTAIRKCEEFLLDKSKKSLGKKLEIATQYNLENLKEKCMSEMTKVSKNTAEFYFRGMLICLSVFLFIIWSLTRPDNKTLLVDVSINVSKSSRVGSLWETMINKKDDL